MIVLGNIPVQGRADLFCTGFGLNSSQTAAKKYSKDQHALIKGLFVISYGQL